MSSLVKRVSWLVLVMVLAAPSPPPVQAVDPGAHWWWPLHVRCPGCPDDYCAKKLPPVPCPFGVAGPDDYCAKPLPWVAPFKYCGVDDYCQKPLPTVVPCYPPWYTCGVPARHVENASSCPCSATGGAPPAH